jgi:hypothetical protein
MRRLLLRLSGGWVPPDWGSSGAYLTLGTRFLYKPQNAVAGDPQPGRRLFRCTVECCRAPRFCVIHAITRDCVSRDAWHLLGHGPQKAGQRTGHGPGDPMGVLPS